MQDRNEWLKWRHKGIGSSDAAVIMGVSPWKTPLELYEEKILPEPPAQTGNTYIMDKGNRMETKIRAHFEFMMGRSFAPKLFAMEKFPYILASLDGYDETMCEQIEIKMCGKDDFANSLKGIVPEKYIPQIDHQLMVSGSTLCHYVCYWMNEEIKDESIHADRFHSIECRPNKERMSALLEAEVKFWTQVENKTPPPLSDKDFKMLKGMAKEANKFRRLKLKAEGLKIEIETAREALIAAAELAGHPRLTVAGLKISKMTRAGQVDYKTVPQLKNVDLNKYRKAGTTFWEIEV